MASIKYEIGDNSNEQQLDIVIKLLPQDPFGRYFVTINQFDLREIQFYTKVCFAISSIISCYSEWADLIRSVFPLADRFIPI